MHHAAPQLALAALAALAVSGCLDAKEGALATPNPPPGSATSFLFAAERAGGLELVRFTPQTGTVTAFDGPMPGVTPATHRISRLWTDASATRVVAVAAARDDDADPSYVLAGDGNGWTVVRTLGTTTVGTVAVAPGLDLIWTDNGIPQPDGSKAPTVHSFAGALLFESPRAPWDEAPRLLGLSPAGDYWVMTVAGDVHVRHVSGEDAVIGPANATWNQGVRLLFETSLVLSDTYPALRWVDLAGQPLEVPGFVGDLSLLQGPYQIHEGALARLIDRGLEPIGAWPGARPPGDLLVATPATGSLLGTSTDGGLDWIDVTGDLTAHYAPTPSDATPRHGGTVEASAALATGPTFSGASLTAVLRVTNWEASGDALYQHPTTYDLWRVDGDGASQVTALDVIADDDLPTLRLTPDGRWLAWVAGGALHRLDLTTVDHETWTGDRVYQDAGQPPPSSLP